MTYHEGDPSSGFRDRRLRGGIHVDGAPCIPGESTLSDLAQWQAVVDSMGFDLKLDVETTVATHTGFLPAKLKGRESGFEFDIGPPADVAGSYPELAARFAGFDGVASFRWGGDPHEMACALVAAAALTSAAEGVWFDPQEGQFRDAAGAVEEARAGLQAVDERPKVRLR